MDLTQRLAGKVAVITGGASGIGLATARRMRAEGATIVVGDIDPRPAKAVADELGGTFVPVDVSDEMAVDNLFDTAAATYGSVDIAFNNAGISPPDDDLIENTELPPGRRVQDVNLKSVYLCCRAALRHMVPAQQGLDHQHRLVRRGDGLGHLADLLHRVQGRGAGDVTRARSPVRAPGNPGQRAVPRTGEHPAAAGAVRQGPRTGGAPAGARADGPVRRAGRTRRRGGVPGQRRRVVHHRRRPSWSTAASPATTSRRSKR